MNADTMSTSITPSFVLLGVALIVWSISASLSSYLGADFEREHAKEGGHSADVIPGSASLEELRKAADDSPENAEVLVQLGYGLLKEARSTSKSEYLMEAIQSFNKTLAIEPDHPGALLGLAALSLQAGVIDKALDYYPRYLQTSPEDQRAKSDYALALIQADQMTQAEEVLQELLKANRDFVPALMTLAFKRRTEGRMEEAAVLAERAREAADDPAVRGNIEGFIAGLSSADGPAAARPGSEVSAAGADDTSRVSPAVRVQNYFSSHPIIGPKLQRIRWESPALVVVEVKDFPVEQMPPFAKAQFENRVKSTFSNVAEQFTVRLADAAGGETMLEITVGERPE